MVKRAIVVGVITALFWAAPVLAQMVVIVHKENPVTTLSSAKLAQYYKGEVQLWEWRKKIVPVDHTDNNPLTAHFAETVLKMDIEMKQKMWITKILSGAGVPPKQFKEDGQVVSFVASEPGAIGYVHKESVSDQVKVLIVDGKREF
jgi:ABC-type phosphate transport system substrate-binding protein